MVFTFPFPPIPMQSIPIPSHPQFSDYSHPHPIPMDLFPFSCSGPKCYELTSNLCETRMWADVKRGGHPDKYRWRPLFNAAKSWLTPTAGVPCSNAVKMQNPLKLAGVPQTTKPISAASGPSLPYCGDVCRRYCCLTSFLPIVNTCLSCRDTVRQSCTMVPKWQIFGDFLRLYFQRAACRTFQTCILNSH